MSSLVSPSASWPCRRVCRDFDLRRDTVDDDNDDAAAADDDDMIFGSIHYDFTSISYKQSNLTTFDLRHRIRGACGPAANIWTVHVTVTALSLCSRGPVAAHING